MLEDNEESGSFQLPRATLNKILKDMIPKHVRVATESRELISDACTEFIHLVTTEANNISIAEKKKTLNPEHIVTALKNLGFDEYLDDVQKVLVDHKEVKRTEYQKKKSLKLDIGPKEQETIREEMILKQQQMFNSARQSFADKSNSTSSVSATNNQLNKHDTDSPAQVFNMKSETYGSDDGHSDYD